MLSGPCVGLWINLYALDPESWVICLTKASDTPLLFIKLSSSDHQNKKCIYILGWCNIHMVHSVLCLIQYMLDEVT